MKGSRSRVLGLLGFGIQGPEFRGLESRGQGLGLEVRIRG
jgi:hypothetical protein